MNPKRLSENSREAPTYVTLAKARRRTSRPWTDEDRQFVIANAEMDIHQLGAALDRSPSAVERYLRVEASLKPVHGVSMLKRGRRPSPGFVRTDDDAHLAAIFQARPRGFAW